MKVWYSLVNAVGDAYSGCTPDTVVAEKKDIVVDLRDAVKNKNSYLLTRVAASQLSVYTNKADIDKNPLPPEAPIGSHGKEIGNLFWIVVPTSHQFIIM